MAGEVTKEQLDVFMSIYKESNVLFEKLLATQTTLIDQQEKIVGRLYNGLAKDIASEVTKQIGDCSKNCGQKIDKLNDEIANSDNENSVVHKLNSIKKDTSDNKENIKISKFFIGGTALAIVIVTVICTVVFRGIDNRKLMKQQIEEIVTDIRANQK